MKKTVWVSVASFLLGTGITVLVVANPFQWGFLPGVRDMLDPVREASAQEEKTLWTCGMHPQIIQEEPGDCPICGMKLVPVQGTATDRPETAKAQAERKIKYWRAPMDPTYISDKPGKSPMGMDLIPVYEDEAQEMPPGTVAINPVFVQSMGVQSEEVNRRDIPFSIRTVGTLAYNDSQIAWITTKYEGWIEKVHVNYVGEPVKKGQKLFEIYSPQLVTTQNEYLQALDYARRMSEGEYPEVAERAQELLRSTRRRLEYWDITEDQIQELESSRQPRRALSVASPVGGLVVEKMNQALEGMYVKPGMNLYQIVDLSTIWVEVEVFENQVPWLELGQKATVELPFEPGKTRVGRVRYLYPFFNDKTRTMKVSVEIPNPGRKLRAEMYANVSFEVPSAKGVLTVPDTAVIHSGKRNLVVLDRGSGMFQVREVTLGVNGDGVWEVQEGIHEGDRVVTSAQFLIDSESNLREAIRKMAGTTDSVPAELPAHRH